VHCIVSGGGLNVGANRWVPTSRKYLFPVLVLGELFRGKMLAALRAAEDRGDIELGLVHRAGFFRSLYLTRWVVYAKRPFGGSEQVISYLGRYTHRIGISNARIEAVAPDGVRFRTKAGRHVTLSPEEFLRRFLLHVLPRGFTKIRHYGLLAAGNVHGPLEAARALLTAPTQISDPAVVTPPPRTWAEIMLALLNVNVSVCPSCRATAVVRRPLPPPVTPQSRDTS
jgi:hypothetical protein